MNNHSHSGALYKKTDKLGGSQAWLMWFVAQLFALMQFGLQLSSGAMVKDVMSTFALTACGGGLLSSVYYYIYVALQTPAGILFDRFGPRLLLSIGAFVCGLGCIIFSHAYWLPMAILGRLLMGGGAAFAFVGVLTILARWFPARRFTLMVAVVESVGMIASIGGGLYMAVIISGMGWRGCMQGMGFLLLIMSPLLWILVRDEPVLLEIPSQNLGKMGRHLPFSDFRLALKKLLRNKQAWANAGYSGMGFAVLTVFGALWGVPFLELKYQVSLTEAVLLADLLFAGAAIGCPLMSVLDNRIQNRSLILAAAALVTAITLTILVFAPNLPMVFLVTLLLSAGISSSAYIINFTVGKEIVGPALRSTSLGFVNTLSVATAPLFQPLVGFIMDLLADVGLDNHVSYSLSNYQWSLAVLIAAQLFAVLLAFWIPSKENLPQ